MGTDSCSNRLTPYQSTIVLFFCISIYVRKVNRNQLYIYNYLEPIQFARLCREILLLDLQYCQQQNRTKHVGYVLSRTFSYYCIIMQYYGHLFLCHSETCNVRWKVELNKKVIEIVDSPTHLRQRQTLVSHWNVEKLHLQPNCAILFSLLNDEKNQ